MKRNLKIMLVAGARPNFMKIAPLIHAIKKLNNSIKSTISTNLANSINSHPIDYILVHTGQHYDKEMSETFFHELEIPSPDINLEVGSASHAVQTAEIMKRFESVLMQYQPDVVVLVGDVNSTLACALVTSKIQYPLPQHSSTSTLQGKRFERPLLAHIEAGLRSFDRSMPEEINRIVTDSLSDLLFTPSEDADKNLIKEGIPSYKIKRVGNIMIDTLTANLEKARSRKTYEKLGLKPKNYVFVTIHRPNNVDDISVLSSIMEKLVELSHRMPVVFPAHPRTQKNLKEGGILKEIIPSRPSPLTPYQNLKILDPIGYLDTISLVENSRFVLTDSGGLQEETTFLGIPCLTLRQNTERPITIKIGTNKLTSLKNLETDFNYLINNEHNIKGEIPELWDGKTSERIVEILSIS